MTEYKGIHFKSRLEARWAIFFDSLNIAYQYKPEEFEFEGIIIVPNFYLPQHDSYVKITDTMPDEDDENAEEMLLSLYTGKSVYILIGDIWLLCHSCHPTTLQTA
jgi:hypothetical protein